jgi:hypothetical protein
LTRVGRAKAGAVTAGALDPGQAHGPEPAQPLQQPTVADRSSRGSRTPGNPPMGSSAVATYTSACVTAPPVMARVTCDGQCHPFPRLRGGTHPLAARTCEPRPLVQDGQIRPARRWVPETWARPTNRFEGQPERHQPNRRSGRTQAPDPTPTPTEGWGSRARSTIHTLPAEYECPMPAPAVPTMAHSSFESGCGVPGDAIGFAGPRIVKPHRPGGDPGAMRPVVRNVRCLKGYLKFTTRIRSPCGGSTSSSCSRSPSPGMSRSRRLCSFGTRRTCHRSPTGSAYW